MTAPNNTSSLCRCCIQLARTAEHDRYQPLLTEASELHQRLRSPRSADSPTGFTPRCSSVGVWPKPCRQSPRAPRSPCDVNLQGLGRYPASIEAALYFCCSEALQNAAKHGGPGTTVEITAHADDQMLTLTISDTGRGFDPATIGTGLTNMTDRLSAIGGDLIIDTAPGRGTRVTAVLATPVQPGRSELPRNGEPRLDLTRPRR